MLIAESDLNDPRVVTPREARGYGIDAQWSDDFHHALFTVLHVERGQGLLRRLRLLRRSGEVAHAHLRLRRRITRSTATAGTDVPLTASRRITSSASSRTTIRSAIAPPATGSSRSSASTARRSPPASSSPRHSSRCIFQGEEFAASTPFQYFADHEEEAMAKAVSEGRRREFAAFGWDPNLIPDPEKRETFERSKLNWDEVDQGAHAEMLEWFTKLIHLRRGSPALNDGDAGHIKVCFDEAKRWLTMERGPVKVMCNLGNEAVEFDNQAGLSLQLASRDDVHMDNAKVLLPPATFALISSEKD